MFQKYLVSSSSGKKHTSYYTGYPCRHHGFEADFAHQLAIGMPDGDRNKFAVSFPLEYIKLLKQNLLYFIGLRSYLSFSISNVRTKKFSPRFLCNWKVFHKKSVFDPDLVFTTEFLCSCSFFYNLSYYNSLFKKS